MRISGSSPADPSLSTRTVRDPVGVITIADERGPAGDAVSPFDRRRLQGTAELGGDQDVRSAAVNILSSFVGQTGTEEGPVQRILQGPRRSRVRGGQSPHRRARG